MCFRELNRKTGSNCSRSNEEQERVKAGVGLPGEEMRLFFFRGNGTSASSYLKKCCF